MRSAVLLVAALGAFTPAAADSDKDKLEAVPNVTVKRVSFRPVLDGITSGRYDRLVVGQQAAFQRCYAQGLKKNPKLQGSNRYTIDKGLFGTSVSAGSPSIGEGVDDCINAALSALDYPRPIGRRQHSVVATYEMTFSVSYRRR